VDDISIEVVDGAKKSNKKLILFKVNFKKTYDYVVWRYYLKTVMVE